MLENQEVKYLASIYYKATPAAHRQSWKMWRYGLCSPPDPVLTQVCRSSRSLSPWKAGGLEEKPLNTEHLSSIAITHQPAAQGGMADPKGEKFPLGAWHTLCGTGHKGSVGTLLGHRITEWSGLEGTSGDRLVQGSSNFLTRGPARGYSGRQSSAAAWFPPPNPRQGRGGAGGFCKYRGLD